MAVRSVEVPDPGDLLTRLPVPSPYAWIHRGDGLVAWGEAARLTLPPGEDRFERARRWLDRVLGGADIDDRVGLPGSGPVAFGSFTFDPRSAGSVLVVPRVILARRDGRTWCTTVGDAQDAARLVHPLLDPGAVRWDDDADCARHYEQAVAQAVQEIRADKLGKVVLARDLRARAEHPIDARILLNRLSTRYPECYTFSCAGLVGATPELLVRHTGQAVESLVLAGTTRRGATPEEDAALGAALMNSAKDRSEHVYAVESVRAALTPLTRRLDVPEEPELLVLPNVQHLASPVSGELADGSSVLDLVAALHPTAAVCGTPSDVAMEAIRGLEGMDRGRYAGPVGWIDARGDGEWGIALRSAEIDGHDARLFAGCGIMADSSPAAELAEAQAKLRAMQDALEG
ncbi:isochorismate synthase [Bailinhaonella thermotolerans]|uniref:isochorismate synthase n=1 Tax=Bailinhaonella thermotolerans TaxID=1070861 RepID=A0A3A4AFH2_9ACTN|nr:isochorismate synthase [Bailinhaonella thermotolerans]